MSRQGDHWRATARDSALPATMGLVPWGAHFSATAVRFFRATASGRYAYRRGAAGDAGIVDCVSFGVMRRMGIRQVFTNDKHFAAAGFDVLRTNPYCRRMLIPPMSA